MENTLTAEKISTVTIIEERGLIVAIENIRKIGFKMSVKALVDISINENMIIQDIRVVEGQDGLTIVMPDVIYFRFLLDQTVFARIRDLIVGTYLGAFCVEV